jgi:hypothetical protein
MRKSLSPSYFKTYPAFARSSTYLGLQKKDVIFFKVPFQMKKLIDSRFLRVVLIKKRIGLCGSIRGVRVPVPSGSVL